MDYKELNIVSMEKIHKECTSRRQSSLTKPVEKIVPYQE